MKYLIKLIPIVLLLAIHPASGMAVKSGNVEAELISEVSRVEAGKSFYIMLKQDIRPDWHTYWVNPGDSGAPTRLEWELPPGFTAGDIEWPYPDRISYGPLMNFGYHGQVLFPVKIQAPASITVDEITIRAKGQWLVCADICIPENADLSLKLAVGTEEPNSASQHLFAKARQKIPRVMDVPASFRVEGESLTLQVKMPGLEPDRIDSLRYFPYTEGSMDNPTPQQFSLVDGGFELKTRIGYDYAPGISFDGIVVIRENSGEQVTAFEILPLSLSGSGNPEGDMSIWLAVFLAFIGGLILNLMPCVFPVLSIKILSLLQQTKNLRRHGWVYMGGVILSFVAIAAILLGLRSGGAEIGWGFQLQSPLVVAVLTYLFFLIGLNLSGYFEIGASFMNLGQGLTQNDGLSASFFTGVLATVVAAPCTAPFMASAIGFALTQSSITAIVIFASLGFGMATPYVLLCHSPGILNRLPRPGPWMERAKELLAFAMYGSAVWLLWVLSIQTGSTGVLFVGIGALSLVFAIWLLKHLPVRPTTRRLTQLVALSFFMVSIYVANLLHPIASAAESGSFVASSRDGYVGPVFENYSEARLTELRQQGPVFVNFTAAWCITCKVNEAVALDSVSMRNTFESRGIRYLKGDWTNEDPVITRKLAEYGRSGVPLYLLFAGGSGRAKILPQLLTENILLEAIEDLGPGNLRNMQEVQAHPLSVSLTRDPEGRSPGL